MAPTYRVEWLAEDRAVEIAYEDVRIDDDAAFDAESARSSTLGRRTP